MSEPDLYPSLASLVRVAKQSSDGDCSVAMSLIRARILFLARAVRHLDAGDYSIDPAEALGGAGCLYDLAEAIEELSSSRVETDRARAAREAAAKRHEETAATR